jgi:cytochrome P450
VGTDVAILLHALHHHPDHYGATAYKFDPDRWLPGAANAPTAAAASAPAPAPAAATPQQGSFLGTK